MNKITSFFKRTLLESLGIEIKINGKVHKNVFNKKYNKRVLISYITEPFINKNKKLTHTNILEALAVGNFFDKNSYIVDVIDFQSSITLDYSSYDIIYGFGLPMENYFLNASYLKKKTIFYLTGFNPEISNILSIERGIEVYQKIGRLFPSSSRVLKFNNFYSLRLSNYLLVLGDKATLDSCFSLKRKNIYQIKSFFINTESTIDLQKKNFNLAKKNFLWFGSHGAIHKGLDILIEIFKNRPEDILYICGLQQNELSMFNAVLGSGKYPNIIVIGFIDVNSRRFIELMEKCAFCVFPSISEGGAPALLTVMANGGLIPICSNNCGLDGFSDYGFVSKDVSIEIFDKLISEASSLDVKEIHNRSICVQSRAANEYNYSQYLKNIDSLLTKFMKNDE